MADKPVQVGAHLLVRSTIPRASSALDCTSNRQGHVPALQGQPGWLGSPIRLGKICELCGELHATVASTLPCFGTYLARALRWESPWRDAWLLAMATATQLACVCADDDCHTAIMAATYAAWTEAK